MNKKGFTLIELMAVLIIISIVAVITVTTVTSVLQNYSDSIYNKQLASIKSAAKVWISENALLAPTGTTGTCNYKSTCPEEYNSITVKLKDLQDEGYIDKELKNSQTKELFDGNKIKVTITKNNQKLVYDLVVEE